MLAAIVQCRLKALFAHELWVRYPPRSLERSHTSKSVTAQAVSATGAPAAASDMKQKRKSSAADLRENDDGGAEKPQQPAVR